MSKFLNRPIAYLQDFDFNAKGDLVNPNIPKDKPVIIMIQANFCGHCTVAKPAFSQFASKNNGRVFCATIQGDGQVEGESELGKRLEVIHPGFRGFPGYVKYQNCMRSSVHNGGREVADLERFASM